MPKGPFDDEFTEEELKAFDGGMADNTVPPEDDSEGAPLEAPEAHDPPAAAQAAQAPEVVPEQAQGNDDGGMSEFISKHAGKTPEELLKIAFQQSQRAGKAEVGQRQTQEQIDQFRTRAADVLRQRKDNIEQRRQNFRQQIEEDPDAAMTSVHEMLLNQDEQAAEHEEHTARIDAAIELASTAIPDFGNRYRDIMAFGQELNYSPEEINAIDDGRNIVTLYLASLSGRLIKSGIMDATGNFRSMPAPTAETDPRLKLPDNAMTSLSTPGNAGGPTGDDASVLAGMLQMTDADFDKLSDAELDVILRRVS